MSSLSLASRLNNFEFEFLSRSFVASLVDLSAGACSFLITSFILSSAASSFHLVARRLASLSRVSDTFFEFIFGNTCCSKTFSIRMGFP